MVWVWEGPGSATPASSPHFYVVLVASTQVCMGKLRWTHIYTEARSQLLPSYQTRAASPLILPTLGNECCQNYGSIGFAIPTSRRFGPERPPSRASLTTANTLWMMCRHGSSLVSPSLTSQFGDHSSHSTLPDRVDSFRSYRK